MSAVGLLPRVAVAAAQTTLVLLAHGWLFDLAWLPALVVGPVLVLGLVASGRSARSVSSGRLLHEQVVAHVLLGAVACLLDGLPTWTWDARHVGSDVLALAAYGAGLRAVLVLRRRLRAHVAVAPPTALALPSTGLRRPLTGLQRVLPPSGWALSRRRTGFRAPPSRAIVLG